MSGWLRALNILGLTAAACLLLVNLINGPMFDTPDEFQATLADAIKHSATSSDFVQTTDSTLGILSRKIHWANIYFNIGLVVSLLNVVIFCVNRMTTKSWLKSLNSWGLVVTSCFVFVTLMGGSNFKIPNLLQKTLTADIKHSASTGKLEQVTDSVLDMLFRKIHQAHVHSYVVLVINLFATVIFCLNLMCRQAKLMEIGDDSQPVAT